MKFLRTALYKAGDKTTFLPPIDFNPYPAFYGAEATITEVYKFRGWNYYAGTLTLNGQAETFVYSPESFFEEACEECDEDS